MDEQTLRNGKPVNSEIATDRALLYGDGVFTTIAINQNKALFINSHLQRLKNDCEKLKIINIDFDSIESSIVDTVKSINKGILRLSISRSSGERGYLCVNPKPVYWISTSAWPEHIEKYKEQGVNVRVCEQRLSANPTLAGIKHCNRLEQVLGRNEWTHSDYQEGLMLDYSGNVIEGTMSNLFIIKDEQIYTPDLTLTGIEGIIRRLIINVAGELQIPLSIIQLSLEEIKDADALFLTNSVIGIWPVNTVDEQKYSRHPYIQQLENALKELSCIPYI